MKLVKFTIIFSDMCASYNKDQVKHGWFFLIYAEIINYI